MNSKTIEFTNPSDLAAATGSPWACPPRSSFADLILKPNYRERNYRFPVGTTTVRVVPAVAGSTKEWIVGGHVLKYNGGRHLHARTLESGNPSVFDIAYRWCRQHRPESLYSKHNAQGYKLLADPVSIFSILVEMQEGASVRKVVARLIVASAYDGSRGGVAGLGQLVWKVFQDRDEEGKLIADPSDPENCPHLVVDRVQSKGTRYPSYSLRLGRAPSPIGDWIERMDTEELDALQTLEQVIHIPEPEEEWKLLEKALPIDLVEEIRASI